jgi:hypothetical protein
VHGGSAGLKTIEWSYIRVFLSIFVVFHSVRTTHACGNMWKDVRLETENVVVMSVEMSVEMFVEIQSEFEMHRTATGFKNYHYYPHDGWMLLMMIMMMIIIICLQRV